MFDVVWYEDKYEKEWDYFVLHESVNGTFLQTRKFLNYHEKGKFRDSSVLVFHKKGAIAAVVPACEITQDEKAVFSSHMGSTFGGIIVGNKYYNANDLLQVISTFEEFIKLSGFNKILLKITSDIFSIQSTELLQYLLSYNDYKEYTELSTYIDFSQYKESVCANFTQGKRTHVNAAIRNGLTCRELNSREEICDFYDILQNNLIKYHTKPVHTVDELVDFKDNRLKEITKFYGVFAEEQMIAGGMVFCFNNSNAMHTQYLATSDKYAKISPMTFLYYSIICKAREIGIDRLSWGISTEEKGNLLNMGLITSKESYGSKYSLNRTFYKEF